MSDTLTTGPHLLERLQWRYATKQFDSSKKIPADVWSSLETSLVLTPSSFGLQPWRFYIVTDDATKQKLLPVTWNQRQVVDCSHHVIFAAKKTVTVDDVDRLIDATVSTRGLPKGALDPYRGMMVGFVNNPGLDAVAWASKQAYIALGQFMASCALLGVDACPMEGIVHNKYDQILGIEADGYAAVVAASAGYRSATDKYATMAKIRYPASEIIKHVTA